MNKEKTIDRHCDVLVIGSGAGGLATAITARKAGLKVIVLEKDNVFGGTTALSGGVLWIPGNAHAAARNVNDSSDAARTYLRHEAGELYDEEEIDAYLEYGPQMLNFFENETEVKFIATDYPDYHPDNPGGADIGRSVVAAPYNARALGPEIKRLRPPLESITFMGMMFNSTNRELRHFFNVTKSLTSALYVTKKLVAHFAAVMRYGRGIQITGGNALVARLAKTAFDLEIPIITGAHAQELLLTDGAVTGAKVTIDGLQAEFEANMAVVLACGGFSQNQERLKTVYPHVSRGAMHSSLAPVGNVGDGIDLAEGAGAKFAPCLSQPAAWMPASIIPGKGGRTATYPHIVDRYKPGVIAVSPEGRRFTNEANSYHDFGCAMLRECGAQPYSWLICDHRTIRKYGLGFVKPAPVPLGSHVRSGYLKKAPTLVALAKTIGVDPAALEATVELYNTDAAKGEDLEFARGSTSFNRFLGDGDHKPNPNVAPVDSAPFYAIKVVMGDIGTFDGIATDVNGHVLRPDQTAIKGLFAVGSDRMSIMGGNYPGAGITLGPAMTFGYITGRYIASSATM